MEGVAPSCVRRREAALASVLGLQGGGCPKAVVWQDGPMSTKGLGTRALQEEGTGCAASQRGPAPVFRR